MKRFGKKVLATVVATTMALGLAACGGASGSGDSGNSHTGKTAAPPQQPCPRKAVLWRSPQLSPLSTAPPYSYS